MLADDFDQVDAVFIRDGLRELRWKMIDDHRDDLPYRDSGSEPSWLEDAMNAFAADVQRVTRLIRTFDKFIAGGGLTATSHSASSASSAVNE